MAHDGLNCFVIHAKRVQVGCESAAGCMPTVPAGKGIVTLEEMRFRLVLIFLLPADRATRQGGSDDAPYEVVQIKWLSISSLEGRKIRLRQFPHSQLVCFERIRQPLDCWNGSAAALCLWLVCHAVPDRTAHSQSLAVKIFYSQPA